MVPLTTGVNLIGTDRVLQGIFGEIESTETITLGVANLVYVALYTVFDISGIAMIKRITNTTQFNLYPLTLLLANRYHYINIMVAEKTDICN